MLSFNFAKVIVGVIVLLSACDILNALRTPVFVSSFGSDHNDGSEESPVQTIDAALRLVAGNGEVLLSVGTYMLTSYIHSPGKQNLTIRAKDTDTLPDLHAIVCSSTTNPGAIVFQPGTSLTMIGVSLQKCKTNFEVRAASGDTHLVLQNVRMTSTNVGVLVKMSQKKGAKGSSVTMRNVTVTPYKRTYGVIGIYMHPGQKDFRTGSYGSRTVRVEDSVFDGVMALQTSQTNIHVDQDSVTFDRCHFIGRIEEEDDDWNPPLSIMYLARKWNSRVTLTNATVDAPHTAFVIGNSSTGLVIKFNNCMLRGNRSVIDDTPTVRTAILFEDRTTSVNGNEVHIDGSTITGFNRVLSGAKFIATILNSTIVNNGNSALEGDLSTVAFNLTDGSRLSIGQSVLSFNEGAEAGVIYAKGNSQFQIQDCLFKSNHASHTGAIFRCVYGSAGTMLGSTLSNNSSPMPGASIGSCDDSCHLILGNNELDGNTMPEYENCDV